MAYNEFTFDLLRSRLGVTVADAPGIFRHAPPRPPGDLFREQLRRNLPLISGIDTEKVRSELIIAPVLVELREMTGHQIGMFSGAELNADEAQGLHGFCAFLLSRAPTLLQVDAPVVAIACAKRESLTTGIPQCVAEMVAARLFNARRERGSRPVYGVVTTGTAWRFLRLPRSIAEVDIEDRFIGDLDAIFGVLSLMVSAAPLGAAP